ncbi:uncharacterized protein LOC121774589 [Salvia splendens]|uniref:uncharacterized protein LOC121774589 n=1 Tax=Salvia splendens TaxID=180675 RepID=UPI001C27D1A9|nr:uncharacterized protein LOC121774589 [Salvia splendens]
MGSSEEDYLLRAIPFVLQGEADTWFMRLPPRSIRTWSKFRQVFLDYFFPSTKINAMKKWIQRAHQDIDETLSKYWERYKGLLDACPNNRMMEANVYNTFYVGLTPTSNDLMNSSSGGDFSKLKVSESKKVLDRLINAKRAYDNPHNSILKWVPVNVYADTAEERMEARMDKMENVLLAAMEKQTQTAPQEKVNTVARQEGVYPSCGPSGLQAQQRGYQNQNSNAPSQPRGSQGPQGNFHRGGGSSSGSQPGAVSNQSAAKQPKGTDELIGDLLNSQQHMQGNMQANNDMVHKLQDSQMEHKAALDMLTKQISQMATTLSEMSGNNGNIPATVKMPDRVNISKITLRSGKDYAEPSGRVEESSEMVIDEQVVTKALEDYEKGPLPNASDPVLPDEEPEDLCDEKKRHENVEKNEGTSHAIKRTKPYPYRGEPKRQKEDPTDFMEIFGKLEINLPLLEALKLPRFSRSIKDFIARKAKADGKIVIGESVSAVIQKKRLPLKRTDPRMFTLPIIIGDVNIEHAMCDLGASINVLPFSIYKKLTGFRLVDTKVIIQLADRSCINPEGVLENVIVRVHNFLYPTDFHVIRMNESETGESSGVLLGRPFLRTTKTIIDVSDGTICLDYHSEKYTFNIDETMKKPLDVENLNSIDVITPLVQEFLEAELLKEKLEAFEIDDAIEKEVSNWCEALVTRELTDDEINKAIMGLCHMIDLAGSSGSAQLNSLEGVSNAEKLPDFGEL